MLIEDLKEKRYTDKGKRSDMFPFKKFVFAPNAANLSTAVLPKAAAASLTPPTIAGGRGITSGSVNESLRARLMS